MRITQGTDGKIFSRHITKEEVQMPSEHMKMALLAREMKFKS